MKRIEQLRNKEKRIAISTQLIEAGVDIDFDVVYRDFAPFDSIIQSAGRCNREGRRKEGIFNVVKLKDENGKFFYSYVYDIFLISKTEKILKKNFYTEKDVLELVENYYSEISKGKSDKTSLELLENLYILKFYDEKEEGKINSIADFVLIKENVYKRDVFIELDEEAKSIWNEFRKIKKIRDIIERRKSFDKLKADFHKYIVSVPVNDNPPPVENGIYYVSYESLEDFYDKNYGFKTTNSRNALIW